MSSDKHTSNERNEASSLEIDISTLASLIASTTTISTTNGARTSDHGAVAEEETDELGMEEVEELMNRIEAANGIADGVEDKLNGILEHLDGLLSSLEAKGETKENDGSKNSQPER
jgi:hypothetical protein